MTYQGIGATQGFAGWSESPIRKATIYNLAAVCAVMIAAGVVASAYHLADSGVANLRAQSMGALHAPTGFRGAPLAR